MGIRLGGNSSQGDMSLGGFVFGSNIGKGWDMTTGASVYLLKE